MDRNRLTVTRSLPHVPSRRDVLRGLAGFGPGVGALRLADAAAAGRKKKRKKRKPRQICQPGTQVGSVNVPGTGATVGTPVLKQGQRYRLRASGFWKSNATHGQDAFADFELTSPGNHVTLFQGVRLGLSVDDGSPDLWGSYDLSYEHVYEQAVIGQGAALSLKCNDVVYADNSGVVNFEVLCA